MDKTIEEHDREIALMERKFGGRWQELCLDLVNVPAAHAIDLLWQNIVTAQDPAFGDWEYPGQAYLHLIGEYRRLQEENRKLKAMCAAAKEGER